MTNKWTVTGTSAADTAKTISKTGISGRRLYIDSYLVYIKGAAAGNDIAVDIKKYDGTTATILWSDIIGSGAARGTRVEMVFSKGNEIEIPQGQTAQLVVAAGGASCITNSSMKGFIR